MTNDWYEGINNDMDIQRCDGEAFRFHSTFKSLVRMILAKVKTPRKYLDDMTGNMAVIRDIYDEYLQHEHQTTRPGEASPLRAMQDRKTIISSAVPFSLAVAYHDPNYHEVGNWFLYRICQEYEAGRFKFQPQHCFPECWYADGRGRAVPDYQRGIEFLKKQGVITETSE